MIEFYLKYIYKKDFTNYQLVLLIKDRAAVPLTYWQYYYYQYSTELLCLLCILLLIRFSCIIAWLRVNYEYGGNCFQGGKAIASIPEINPPIIHAQDRDTWKYRKRYSRGKKHYDHIINYQLMINPQHHLSYSDQQYSTQIHFERWVVSLSSSY